MIVMCVLLQCFAQTAAEDSERIFTEIIRSIQKRRSEVKQLIRVQERTAVSRAEARAEELEQEINDLKRRDTELKQFSEAQDHVHFLQVTDLFKCRTGKRASFCNNREFVSVELASCLFL